MSATRDRSAVVRPCAPRRGGATGRVTGPFFHGSVPGSGAPGMARAGAAVKPAPRDVAGPFGTFRARPAPGLPAPRAHADARPRALAMRSGHTGRPVKPDLRIGAATVTRLRGSPSPWTGTGAPFPASPPGRVAMLSRMAGVGPERRHRCRNGPGGVDDPVAAGEGNAGGHAPHPSALSCFSWMDMARNPRPVHAHRNTAPGEYDYQYRKVQHHRPHRVGQLRQEGGGAKAGGEAEGEEMTNGPGPHRGSRSFPPRGNGLYHRERRRTC